MAFLALVAGALAIVALNRKHVGWGWAAVGASALSIGPLGSGVLVAIAGAGFLVFAHAEGEHRNLRTREIESHEWPDKAFAEGLVLVVAGLTSLVWGGALLLGLLQVEILPPFLLGVISIVSGIASLAVARELRHQRAFGLALGACALAFAASGSTSSDRSSRCSPPCSSCLRGARASSLRKSKTKTRSRGGLKARSRVGRRGTAKLAVLRLRKRPPRRREDQEAGAKVQEELLRANFASFAPPRCSS
jgi:hypothetical protein